MVLLNRLILSILFLLGIAVSGFSQTQVFNDESFTDIKVNIPSSLKDYNLIILNKDLKVELIVNDKGTFQYKLFHEHLFINKQEGVAQANKVYIPFRKKESNERIQVRVIHPGGRITEMKNADILEEKNEESGVTTQYFAIKGLETGAIIEKIYILQETPVLDGETVYFQSTIPVLTSTFEFIFPDYLEFKWKSYNNLPIAELNQAYGEKTHSIGVSLTNVPVLPEDERYSNEIANEMQFKYKLYSNKLSQKSNLNNYTDFTRSFYDVVTKDLDKKSIKALEKFVNGIRKSTNKDEQIRLVEEKVKAAIKINDYAETTSNFTDILSTKQSTKFQLVQLYWAIFQQMNIPVELVLTSKKTTVLFDKEFELMDQLTNALFYFPQTGNYLDPESFEYRYPLFNFTYLGGTGLFIKKTIFGGVAMGLGEVRDIGIPEACISRDSMYITVDFRSSLENPKVEILSSSDSYSAFQYQLMRDLLAPSDYDQFLNDITENHVEKSSNPSRKLNGEGLANIGKNPFVLEITCSGADLIRKAGDTYLCNVGVLIGKQIEMYQIKERVFPVDVRYPHYYYRVQKFLLPDGYEIQNPEDFQMHYTCGDPTNLSALWDSKLEKQGNVYTAVNTEYYRDLTYPLSDFDDYRKVVNAAADYNKIVIAIGKK